MPQGGTDLLSILHVIVQRLSDMQPASFSGRAIFLPAAQRLLAQSFGSREQRPAQEERTRPG